MNYLHRTNIRDVFKRQCTVSVVDICLNELLNVIDKLWHVFITLVTES